MRVKFIWVWVRAVFSHGACFWLAWIGASVSQTNLSVSHRSRIPPEAGSCTVIGCPPKKCEQTTQNQFMRSLFRIRTLDTFRGAEGQICRKISRRGESALDAISCIISRRSGKEAANQKCEFIRGGTYQWWISSKKSLRFSPKPKCLLGTSRLFI